MASMMDEILKAMGRSPGQNRYDISDPRNHQYSPGVTPYAAVRNTSDISDPRNIDRPVPTQGSGKTPVKDLFALAKRSQQPTGVAKGMQLGAQAGKGGLGSAINRVLDHWNKYKNSASTDSFNAEPQIPSYNMPMYSKSLEDFMRMASQHTAGQYDQMGAGLDAREAALRKNAELANTAIGGIYGDLVDNLGTSRENIGQSYDAANAQILETGEATTQGLTNAFNESQNTQADIARSLGIEDALVGLHESGNQAQKDNQFSVERANTQMQKSADEMTANRSAQMDLNTGLVDSTNMRTAEEKTLVQNDLMNYLAQLEDERASVALQQQRDNMSLAMQLYNDDYSRFSQDQQMRYGMFNDQRNFELGLDDRSYQREWEQEQYYGNQALQQQQMQAEAQAQGQPQAPKYSDLGSFGQFRQNTQQILQNSGINPSKSVSVDRAIQSALSGQGNRALRNGDIAGFAEAVVESGDGSIPPEILYGLATQYFKMNYIK